MARAEQISLAIRLFKIYDLEEREDLRIEAIRNIIKKKEIEIEKSSIKKLPNSKNTARLQDETPKVIEYPTNKGLYQEIMSGTISTRTAPRGYKHFLINGINNSISEMFGEMREKYVGDQKFDVLDNMDWIFNELIIVKEHIANCCPPHWNIFEVYFDQYYKELHSLITDLVESEPETIIILDILAFDKTFQDTLKQDFGFTKSEVKSVIGDKEKETLFKDYLNLIVVKMTEWKKQNLMYSWKEVPRHILIQMDCFFLMVLRLVFKCLHSKWKWLQVLIRPKYLWVWLKGSVIY